MALTDPPDPQQPVVRPGDGRVDEDWYRWFLAFVLFTQQLQAFAEGIEGDLAALEIKDVWAHTRDKAKDGTYFLCWAPFAGAIDSTVTDSASGTCTARWRINGVNVGSAANSVSTTQDKKDHSTANTFSAGDRIEYVISSNSSCLGALLQANVTRKAS